MMYLKKCLKEQFKVNLTDAQEAEVAYKVYKNGDLLDYGNFVDKIYKDERIHEAGKTRIRDFEEIRKYFFNEMRTKDQSVEQLFLTLDRDGDGVLSWDEFTRGVMYRDLAIEKND
jgi:hypothetical protein